MFLCVSGCLCECVMCVCRRLSNEAACRHASANRMRALPWRCVCVCVFSSAADSNKEEEGWARRERKCVRVWACVCVLAARRKSPVQQLSKRHNPPPAHTQYEHTHAHRQYMRRILFFLHNLQSLHPSLLPSLALSFSLICSELNYTRMHTHTYTQTVKTHMRPCWVFPVSSNQDDNCSD